MPHTQCRYCEQSNPPDAKFCNACGGQLNLAPCPRCGAVNELTAKTCHQCRSELGGSAPGLALEDPLAIFATPAREPAARELTAREASLPVKVVTVGKASADSEAAPHRRLARRRSRAIVGTLAVAGIGIVAYQAYRPAPPDNAPARERSEADAHVRPIVRQAGDGQASGAAVAGARSTGSAARPATPCTTAVAALGLCAPGAPPKEVRVAAPAAAALPPRQPAGSAEGRCADAVAALGLCAPKTTRRAE